MNAFSSFSARRIAAILLLLGWFGPWSATAVKAWSDHRALTCCGTRGQCPMHPAAPCPPAIACACGMSAPPAPLTSPPPLLVQPALVPGRVNIAIPPRAARIPEAGTIATAFMPLPPRRPPRG